MLGKSHSVKPSFVCSLIRGQNNLPTVTIDERRKRRAASASGYESGQSDDLDRVSRSLSVERSSAELSLVSTTGAVMTTQTSPHPTTPPLTARQEKLQENRKRDEWFEKLMATMAQVQRLSPSSSIHTDKGTNNSSEKRQSVSSCQKK